MNEEKYIEEQVGKRNPFRVPDGYFDQLTEQVMASLPEKAPVQERPRAKRVVLRPWYFAAAAVAVFLVSVSVWQFFPASAPEPQAQMPVAYQEPSEADFEEAADYLMLDNYDIYACLTDNY